MGASSSREVRRILWLDTEGGIRGVPCWDIALVNETMQGLTMHRICCAKGVSKRIKGRLRNSLPHGASAEKTLVLDYKIVDNQWVATSYKNTDNTLSECLAQYLRPYVGATMCAWGMNTHDNRVVSELLPPDLSMSDFKLVDCMLLFRRSLKLPKNSLASDRAGTPRGLFNVGCPPGLGAVHTAHVDALNMRTLCHRAFHSVIQHGDMLPRPDQTYNQPRTETFESVWYALKTETTEPLTLKVGNDCIPWVGAAKDFTWLLQDHFWEPRKVKPQMKKDVQNRLQKQLKHYLEVDEIPCDLMKELQACDNHLEYTQCLLNADQYLTQK
tara:strand:- start:433 stop:1413 length:981 start_codon:yes stop_codon:yes gene_type:complete